MSTSGGKINLWTKNLKVGVEVDWECEVRPVHLLHPVNFCHTSSTPRTQLKDKLDLGHSDSSEIEEVSSIVL